MDNNEKKGDMLSFDKLREGLGIDEKLSENQTDNTIQSIEDAQREAENPVVDRKSIVENGNTFIDITDQISFYEVDSVADVEILSVPVIEAEKPIQTTETKKRIKTFNEIIFDFFKVFIPVKEDSGKEKIRKISMDISLVLIIFCIIGIVGVFTEGQHNFSNSNNMSNQVVSVDKLDNNKYAEAWKDVYAQSSGTFFPDGMDSKYAYLYYANQDLVGWLSIDNTNINTQIVQSNDNVYYLSKDFYKNSNNYGCPFLDYKNNTQTFDDNTIIYGPSIGDNLMFASLNQYKTVEGYKKSPLIEYSNLYGTYTFKVFAAFIATDSPTTDNGFNYTLNDFISDAKFSEFINEVKSRSIINTDVSVQTDDKIITLVTTSGEFEGARLVVMGRMVRDDESIGVDLDDVELNSSPKYPQAWYNK